MSPKTVKLSIMFADISESTRLFEVLGDEAARKAIADALELLTKVILSYKGKVIKTIGDEIMCIFPTADDSADAATDMQETLKDAGEIKQDAPEIKIRIGIHYGSALLERGDVFGDAVNVAARMVAQAKGDQIITTKATVDLLKPAVRANTRFVDRASIKGKKDDIDIFEIIWQEEDVTRMATGMLKKAPATPRVALHIKYGGRSITLNTDKSGLVIGRSQACDLPVNEKLASRQHARIELRRDKFFIIDQSTNGTHIRMDNTDDAFLRREETPITANGEISLGRSFAEIPTEVISFTLESS